MSCPMDELMGSCCEVISFRLKIFRIGKTDKILSRMVIGFALSVTDISRTTIKELSKFSELRFSLRFLFRSFNFEVGMSQDPHLVSPCKPSFFDLSGFFISDLHFFEEVTRLIIGEVFSGNPSTSL